MKDKNPFTVQFGCLVAYRGKDTEVIIPDGVTAVGRRAFYGNRTLKAVTLPASVTTVEQEAFDGCTSLEKITILGKMQSVGKNAFGWFFQKDALQLSVYSAVPIEVFTKSAQEDALRVFVRRYAEFDPSTDVFAKNLRFLGTHSKQKQQYGGKLFYHYLLENAALRHAVLAADAVPAKDLKWLIAALQDEGQTEVTAELLDYQNRLLADEKVKKSLEKSEARAEQKALSTELSIADWRKLLKFGYENGDIVIKKVMIREPTIVIPDHIGEKAVRVIATGAFSYNRQPGQAELWSPEKIVLPESVTEIRRGAFFCLNNTEIVFPRSVRSLPEGCLVAAENVALTIPASVEQIPDDLVWDSPDDAIRLIRAPSGSYAEQYAKKKNIPFVAE